jgi:hypothetical protein
MRPWIMTSLVSINVGQRGTGQQLGLGKASWNSQNCSIRPKTTPRSPQSGPLRTFPFPQNVSRCEEDENANEINRLSAHVPNREGDRLRALRSPPIASCECSAANIS